MANDKIMGKVKDQLFNNFFEAAQTSLRALEHQFDIHNVYDQVFGGDVDEVVAKENLRNSPAWKTLVSVYDYAVNGVEPAPLASNDGPYMTVLDASDVLKLVMSEEADISDEWQNIIFRADGRVALDNGSPVGLEKVAFLAAVDVRTVRNAISSGELVSVKQVNGRLAIENASARRWLHGRRGFKPTVWRSDDSSLQLETVDTPAEFALFLAEQRKRLGLDGEREKLVCRHPSATPEGIAQLETGVFALPLDSVFPLADFYQLDRKAFLLCVMRVFFNDELRTLSDHNEKSEV